MDYNKLRIMKKIFLAVMLLMAAGGSLYAQTWSEWFRQNSTQKKYLLQQIAALKVYIDYGQKGYSIAKNGLNGIGNFAGSEFNLHSTFLNSRRIVNPKIKNYVKVRDIITLQEGIIADYNRTHDELSQNKAFEDAELDYVFRVFKRLLDNCTTIVEELTAVTTDGQLEMSDDERIARIDKLYLQMQDNWNFCRTFSNEAAKMALARKKEMNDVKTGRALQGFKNPQP